MTQNAELTWVIYYISRSILFQLWQHQLINFNIFQRNLIEKPIYLFFVVNMGQIIMYKICRALSYPKSLAWLREGDMCPPDVSCAVSWWGQRQFSLRVEPYRVHWPLMTQILQCTLLGLYRPDSGWVVYKKK